MVMPIVALYLLTAIAWLVVGIRGRKENVLLMLNLYWWLGSLVSAHFAWLAWQERGYSENWAMIGFMFYSLPYLIVTGSMVGAELFLIRKWQTAKTRAIKWISLSLLIFLLLQIIMGIRSA